MEENNKLDKMEQIVNLAKRRGFIIGSSEIYGGIASIYDWGPLGLALKNNLKNLFWKNFVQKRLDMEGIETSIIMHPKVWEASGHLKNFSDPLVECQKCHLRFREDHLENYKLQIANNKQNSNDDKKIINLSSEISNSLKCPQGGEHQFDQARQFNLMFKTYLGATEESTDIAYLRPETAQGMFVNFRYIQEVMRKKIPFGIAQIGKSFRNEISLGNFIFRLREFEIAELEYFVKPGEDEASFDSWVVEWENFLTSVGLSRDNLRREEKAKESLAHYSKATTDIYYKYPHGWDEIAGIANRTDFDLQQHMELSKKDLSYFDNETGQKYIPYVIEPTLGIDRLVMAVLCEAYMEFSGGRGEKKENSSDENSEKEIVLDLQYSIAPINVAILPLVKKGGLREKALEIVEKLNGDFIVDYDESGSIGRRYRRQDEVGTPFCITVDFETLDDQKVTIRDRRTMQQSRVSIDKLKEVLKNSLTGNSLLVG